MRADELKVESWPPAPSTGMLTGKIEEGIRITHVPTGKHAECTLYRHQYKNKAEALRLLSEQVN